MSGGKINPNLNLKPANYGGLKLLTNIIYKKRGINTSLNEKKYAYDI